MRVVIRLLGLLGGLSVATDLGSGAPLEEALKRCLVAERLARAVGQSEDQVREVMYTALLQHVGCTAYAHEVAAVFGDDVAATRFAFLTDASDPRDLARTFVPGVAEATGRARARVLLAALAHGRRIDAEGPAATCQVARDTARRLRLEPGVQTSLFHTLAMWNGNGYPEATAEGIPLGARIMHVAATAVQFCLHGGVDEAMAQVRRRSGTYLDPALVATFPEAALEDIDTVDAYDAVLEAEPDPVRCIDDTDLEEVARTFGDVVDLKTPWLRGHSTGVADLAGAAARQLGIGERITRVAGHLHDVGRVGVSSAIWAKPRPLTSTERDQARLHPYYTDRVLSRLPGLDEVAAVAGRHHERLDGSGYHRGLNASQLSVPARVLAAADRYRSQVEDRPYRPAATPAEAARRLRAEVRQGRLDADAVDAVLTAAGERVGLRRPRAAGLTDRQVEVLRLLARGSSNRQIGQRLGISGRTAEHHVQDVYTRIGVSTRAAAALFAMEHGLLGESE
jgi:HD-GYP domain-containing protein (c-di-GMP phosphodiesterase class II)